MAQRWSIRPSALLSGSHRDFALDAAIVAAASEAERQMVADAELQAKTGIDPSTSEVLRQRYEAYKAAEAAGVSERG